MMTINFSCLQRISCMKKLINIYVDSFKGLNKDVFVFALMMLINRIGTLILPFLTLYTTQQLGWTKIDAGTATMWFGLGSLVGAYLGGEMTNKIGYYKTMAISLFSAGVAFYFLQFVTEFYMFCGFLFVSSLLADLIRPALWSGITYFTNKDIRPDLSHCCAWPLCRDCNRPSICRIAN